MPAGAVLVRHAEGKEVELSTQSPGAGPASDRCPQCGTTVVPTMTFSVGGGLRDPVHQKKQCPSCGAQLQRNVGEPWRVLEDGDGDDAG
ncbi:MAG: hypothetical protein QOE35_2451 [Actinomycetota bacterium]